MQVWVIYNVGSGGGWGDEVGEGGMHGWGLWDHEEIQDLLTVQMVCCLVVSFQDFLV
jgi:hypothetical protein